MADEQELTLEEVVEVDPAEATDEQKAFLEEHKSELTPEQAEKFGIEKEEEIKSEDIEPEVRGGGKKEKEEKEEEDEIDPDDEKTISKIVDRKVGSKVREIENNIEVNSFIQSRPEYSKYKDSILKYMNHEAYSRIPVHNIASIVAAKDLEKIGAKKEREAAQKAKETQGGGTPARKQGGTIDWLKASKEDVAAQRAKIMGYGG